MLIEKKGPISPKRIKYAGATFKRTNIYVADDGTKVEVYEYIHQFHEPKYLVKFNGTTIELNNGELENYLNNKFGGIKNGI